MFGCPNVYKGGQSTQGKRTVRYLKMAPLGSCIICLVRCNVKAPAMAAARGRRMCTSHADPTAPPSPCSSRLASLSLSHLPLSLSAPACRPLPPLTCAGTGACGRRDRGAAAAEVWAPEEGAATAGAGERGGKQHRGKIRTLDSR